MIDLTFVEPVRDFEIFLTETLRQNTHVRCRELLIGGAENISGKWSRMINETNPNSLSVIRDNHVDAVVSTLTLSSCRDVHQALREIRRILKPVSPHIHLIGN